MSAQHESSARSTTGFMGWTNSSLRLIGISIEVDSNILFESRMDQKFGLSKGENSYFLGFSIFLSLHFQRMSTFCLSGEELWNKFGNREINFGNKSGNVGINK